VARAAPTLRLFNKQFALRDAANDEDAPVVILGSVSSSSSSSNSATVSGKLSERAWRG